MAFKNFTGWFKKQFRGNPSKPSGGKPRGKPSGKSAHSREHEKQRKAFDSDPDDDLPLADELNATEADVFNGELIFATSSNVEEWRYIGKTSKLYVRFKSGGIYRYDNVPFPTALAFFKTDSPGRFVHWHLKGKFPYAKIGEMEPMPHHNVIQTID